MNKSAMLNGMSHERLVNGWVGGVLLMAAILLAVIPSGRGGHLLLESTSRAGGQGTKNHPCATRLARFHHGSQKKMVLNIFPQITWRWRRCLETTSQATMLIYCAESGAGPLQFGEPSDKSSPVFVSSWHDLKWPQKWLVQGLVY